MGNHVWKGAGRAMVAGLVLGLMGCVGQVDGMKGQDVPPAPTLDGGGGDIPNFDAGTPPVDEAAVPPGPESELPTGNNGIRLVPTSEVASSGIIDPVSTAYQYAPEMMYVNGTYYFWDCWGVSGDYIGFKSGPSLESLGGQPMGTALMPVGDENHTCDPSVVKGADGHYYLHYSYLPNGYATWAAVAVSDSPAGPWWRLGPTVGSPSLNELDPGSYGRGQTSVARGFDGAYYMIFTNQIAPKEGIGIVMVRSPDASFRTGMQEVARFTGPELAGWSVDMAYDPASRHFLMTVPGPGGVRITTVNTSFQIDGAIVLAANSIHKESQTFVTNEYGELIRPNGQFTIVSGQPGPRDSDWATSPATGPIFWETHNVSLSGVLGAQDFESGTSDGWVSWGGANIVNYEAVNAVSGSRLLAFNAGAGTGSVQRDHGIEVTPGSSWLATARVTGETETATGTYCLWFLGITGNEQSCTPYSVKSGEWTTVTVLGRPSGAHDVIRAEFYPGAGTTRVDNTRTEALVTAQTFESGSGEGWSIYPNTTGNMVNYDVTSSYGGSRLLAFNSGTGDGSVLNDFPITINAGSTFYATAMLRSQGGTATGSYCLWLLGDSANESTCAPYTVNDLGWTRLDIASTATGRHTVARIQFYPAEGTTFIDNSMLR